MTTITRQTKEQIGKDKFCKYLERKKTFEDRIEERAKLDLKIEDVCC